MKIAIQALFTLIIFFPGKTEAQEMKTKAELITHIQNEFQKVEGTFAVAIIDCDDASNSFEISGDTVFHAASTMKTPVMMEVFKKISEKKFKLNDTILLENDFTSIVDGSKFSLSIDEDSGEKLYSSLNKHVKIYDLIFEMITVSSNLATNVLIEIVSAKDVMKTLGEYGIDGVTVLRGVEDIKAFDLGMNNTVTANGLAKLYTLLAQKKLIDENSSNQMIEILLQQKFNTLIPGLLPDGVKVAHKTGSISGVEHDSGIVFLPNGKKYVFVFLSKNLKRVNQGRELGAQISKAVYDYLNR